MMTTSSLQYIFFLITVAFIQRPVVGRYIVAPLSHNYCNLTFLACEVQKRQRKNSEKQVHLPVPAHSPPSNLFSCQPTFHSQPQSPPSKKEAGSQRGITNRYFFTHQLNSWFCVFFLFLPPQPFHVSSLLLHL